MSQDLNPKPCDEEYRPQVPRGPSILDTEAAPDFDRVVRLATRHFQTKYALVSLVNADRQWFKASCDLDATQTPREFAFSAQAIMGEDALVVLDATRDPRFAENPLVAGPPMIRFYAGWPLIVDDAAIGTLCIIDDKTREAFGEEDHESLSAFAKIIEDEISLREHMLKSTEDLEARLRNAQMSGELSQMAKTQFLAMMSEELKTPLNAILGFAECIADECMGPIGNESYKNFAQEIRTSGKRQLELIERLLQLTDKGTIDLEEEIIELHEFASRCAKLMSGEAMIARVTVEVLPPKEPVYLKADPVHIEQIMLELIGNGIKFSPKDGRVSVEISIDAGGCTILEVKDSGIGIDEKALDKAVAVFGQLSTGNNRRYGGAGIGVPIVKKLAELHGAKLSLSSPQGGGTQAQVRFPKHRTAAERVRGASNG